MDGAPVIMNTNYMFVFNKGEPWRGSPCNCEH